MPISRPTIQRILPHLLVLLTAVMIFVTIGGGLLYWRAERMLAEEARKDAGNAVASLDNIFRQADNAARAIIKLKTLPCDQAEATLKQIVTTNPFLRTVNLTFDRVISCSSLFGAQMAPDSIERFGEEPIWLIDGTPIKPDSPVMGYHLTEGQWGALVAVDGEHLQQALQSASPESLAYFIVNDAWLAEEGQVQHTPLPSGLIGQTRMASTNYPFSVMTGFAMGMQWRYLFSRYLPYFGFLILMGLAAGFSIRITTPRRDLKRALEAGEFEPYYQPLARVTDNTWYGLEVLIRWNHPKKGLIEPNEFIPLAERTGLIIPITRALMTRVAKDLSANLSALPEGFHVGINISAAHCRDLSLIEDCRKFLAFFPPKRIKMVLELTERQMIEPTPVSEQLFSTLRSMGIEISIDDFGTGYSSLSYLRKFEVDNLKIDQSFVAAIGSDALSRHIIDSIIDLSTKMDLYIVAEGVETPEQRQYLTDHAVDYLQGYLFSYPLTLAGLVACLKQPPIQSERVHTRAGKTA